MSYMLVSNTHRGEDKIMAGRISRLGSGYPSPRREKWPWEAPHLVDVSQCATLGAKERSAGFDDYFKGLGIIFSDKMKWKDKLLASSPGLVDF